MDQYSKQKGSGDYVFFTISTNLSLSWILETLWRRQVLQKRKSIVKVLFYKKNSGLYRCKHHSSFLSQTHCFQYPVTFLVTSISSSKSSFAPPVFTLSNEHSIYELQLIATTIWIEVQTCLFTPHNLYEHRICSFVSGHTSYR